MSVNVGTTAPTTLPGASTAPTNHPEQQPAVLVEADKALDDFKRLMETQCYPRASALRERAKMLFEEVKLHWTEGKHKVLHEHGKWSSEDFDSDMMKLLKKQESTWGQLEVHVAAERSKMDATYQKVLQAKAAVDHARGSVHHVPVVDLFFDLSTPEQHTICHVYQKKLHAAFADAAKEYQALEGYPDGLLTQVHALRKHAMEETARLVEWLSKKDRHHRHKEQEQQQEQQQEQHAVAEMPQEAVTPATE
jgi:hypothetical protein